MFSLTLCGRLHATKSKCTLGVSDTQRPVFNAGLLELCQSSHRVISESSCAAKNLPGWQLSRCADTSHRWQTASPPAAPAQASDPAIGCDAHPWMGQAAGDQGGSSHHRWVCAWAEQSYVSQADSAGEAIPASVPASAISWFSDVIKTNFGA